MKVDINSPEISVLRKTVEQKFGCPIESPRIFSSLSFDIEEKLSEYLSDTTLQRIWLYKSGYGTVAIHSLNVLSRYCGFLSWDAFKNTIKESSDVESEMFDGESIDASTLAEGTCIRIGWMPDRICTIKYLGHLKFVAIETANSKLMEGDVFTCNRLQLGREIRIDDLDRGGRKMSYIAGERNGLTLLEIIH